MNKKILFIAVHPDDETLGCGGVIQKHKDLGNDIFWLIITKTNAQSLATGNSEQLQKDCIKTVSSEYGFSGYKHLSLLTTLLDTYPLGEIIKPISDYINSIQPDTIYLNHHADVHSDHRVSYDAIISCTKNFRYPFIKKIYTYETLSETEFAPPSASNAFLPNTFVDISKYLDKKLEIMKIYSTEIMKKPLPRSISTIEALARFRGSRIGVDYAEAFTLLYEKK